MEFLHGCVGLVADDGGAVSVGFALAEHVGDAVVGAGVVEVVRHVVVAESGEHARFEFCIVGWHGFVDEAGDAVAEELMDFADAA